VIAPEVADREVKSLLVASAASEVSRKRRISLVVAIRPAMARTMDERDEGQH
jgi:hypothetical protein